jgi:thiamine pyrophosphate-dependent acetolactate synthase large subunit-like protein
MVQKVLRLKKISEINEALRAALKSNKPSVIDVDVDPKALYSFRRDSFKHREKNECRIKKIYKICR